jgi:hypothetical protein
MLALRAALSEAAEREAAAQVRARPAVYSRDTGRGNSREGGREGGYPKSPPPAGQWLHRRARRARACAMRCPGSRAAT